MFCSKKSAEKINAIHERPLRIIRNDFKSLYPLLLEETQQTTFHQRCINSLMIEVYKYLNRHSPDIMSDIFKLRENTYNLRNFHILQTENRKPSFNEIRTGCYSTSLWQQVLTDMLEAASLILFKNRIKTWKCEVCACRSCKIFIQNVGYI